jgi:hypothetical protein
MDWMTRFCVRTAHAKSGFLKRCATRNASKSPIA